MAFAGGVFVQRATHEKRVLFEGGNRCELPKLHNLYVPHSRLWRPCPHSMPLRPRSMLNKARPSLMTETSLGRTGRSCGAVLNSGQGCGSTPTPPSNNLGVHQQYSRRCSKSGYALFLGSQRTWTAASVACKVTPACDKATTG